MKENWAPIAGYYGFYEVSDLGNVRSKDGLFRNQYTTWQKKGKILKPRVHTNGYLRVNLWINEKPKDKYIHRLVADAFIKSDMERPFINHKDGNKKNNTLSNLERCNAKENIQHAKQLGLIKPNVNSGISNGNSKLDWVQINTIRSCHKDGMSAKDISKYFLVNRNSIYPIVNGKSWRI